MPKNHPDLTAERLRELLAYDPETGIFTRRIAAGGAIAGTKAGTLDSHGYVQIKINSTLHLAHRLAWLYVHGLWPENHLDHRDRIPSHNWIKNLRPATYEENQQNASIRKDNTSGYVGVSFFKRTNRWRVQIQVKGKKISVGYYQSIEDAIAARAKAKAEFHKFQPFDAVNSS